MSITQLETTGKPSTRILVDSAFNIAKNLSGIAWENSKQWDMPLDTELRGDPFLVVMDARMAGSFDDGGNFRTGRLSRGHGNYQPVWDIDIYGITPFAPLNPKTYTTPRDTLDTLIQTFISYYNLNGAQDCYSTEILDPNTGPLFFDTGSKYWRCKLTIRCYTKLLAIFRT